MKRSTALIALARYAYDLADNVDEGDREEFLTIAVDFDERYVDAVDSEQEISGR